MNKSPIKPLADRVVAIREEVAQKTASGIYLPETAKEKPVIATIVAVGPEADKVKVGDKIVYKEYSTTELKINGQEYLIIKQEDILATI